MHTLCTTTRVAYTLLRTTPMAYTQAPTYTAHQPAHTHLVGTAVQKDGERGRLSMSQVKEIAVYRNNGRRFDVHFMEKNSSKVLCLKCPDGNKEWINAMTNWGELAP